MCDMINSYLDTSDYGYDQINIGSSDINQILNTLDTNSIHDIDTIREREVRMFNKLNAYQPLQSIPNDKYKPYNNCKPNLYGEAGSERVRLRRNVKEDIEKYYHGTGSVLKDQLKYPSETNQTTIAYPMLYRKQTPSLSQLKAMQLNEKKTESFQSEISDMEYLQDELYKMEQKNNMFVIFIFFLVIVVLVQYAKGSNDPMRILVVPTGSSGTSQSYSENRTIEL
jgi:hypothetical protein